jgi:homospermidine synthase
VVGGYVAGIAWLLGNRRAGVVDPEVVPAGFGIEWGGPFWGPVVVMPFKSPFVSNKIEDMGLVRQACQVK